MKEPSIVVVSRVTLTRVRSDRLYVGFPEQVKHFFPIFQQMNYRNGFGLVTFTVHDDVLNHGDADGVPAKILQFPPSPWHNNSRRAILIFLTQFSFD